MPARFEVRLDGGERDGGVLCFEPGQQVGGSVEVEADTNVECRHLEVRLIWHTEGRGDEDAATIEKIDIFQGRLGPGFPVRSDFRFTLPLEPWSYAGTYVNIIWAIEVNGDVPMARDLNHRERFVVRPRAAR
jgi:hypothetical protein